MSRRWIAALLGVLLQAGWAWAGESAAPARLRVPPEALDALRLMPIQHNGRHKPLDSFAREIFHHLAGSPRLGREDALVTVLSIIATPEPWQATPLLLVPFGPLREALGMAPGAMRVSQEELLTTRRLMRMLPAIVEKQRRDEKLSMLEQETMDLFERFVAFSSLVEHRLELVPSPAARDAAWRSIQQPEGYPPAQQAEIKTVWAAWITALREGHPAAINAATAQLAQTLHRLNPSAYPPAWRRHLEVGYNRFQPFRAARMLYLLAVIGLLIGWWAKGKGAAARGGMVVFGLAVTVHVMGILLRVVIGGRPPVSNFFETMLWLPFAGVVSALILERIYHAGFYAFSASLLAAMVLWLSDYVPLDSSISPVVAVLRSNLWLTVHVLTVVASYGVLMLAAVLAHIYGVLSVLRQPRRTLVSLDLFLYRTLQIGVVLLAGGIMLGAVWANASWGRYWGWDPKETWALITLLWFLAILHGRFAGWLKGVGVALATIAGFFLLLMTYYGVSFYLVGLHSYAGGHAKPLPPLVIGYVLAELAFLATVAVAAARRRPT